MKQSSRTAFGMFTQVTACNRCYGQGTIIEEKCGKCNGSGNIKVTRTIDLKIPPGVEEGSQLRLHGEGESGPGGIGDLYIVVHVHSNKQFRRQGADLYMGREISFPDAALGTKITIETLSGEQVILKIPDGTQNGDVFKLKRKGMPTLHGRGYGDLFVKVHVRTPKNLSRKAKKILEDLKKELSS